MGRLIAKLSVGAAVAAATFVGAATIATEASAQPRGGWNRGYYGGRGYYRPPRNNWGAANSVIAGAAIGAAIAGAPYYGRGGYGWGYGPGVGGWGPGYYGGGAWGNPGWASPGWGNPYNGGWGRTCQRRVWDPYIGRNVRIRTPC